VHDAIVEIDLREVARGPPLRHRGHCRFALTGEYGNALLLGLRRGGRCGSSRFGFRVFMVVSPRFELSRSLR
jgi:hypothetical protein